MSLVALRGASPPAHGRASELVDRLASEIIASGIAPQHACRPSGK